MFLSNLLQVTDYYEAKLLVKIQAYKWISPVYTYSEKVLIEFKVHDIRDIVTFQPFRISTV